MVASGIGRNDLGRGIVNEVRGGWVGLDVTAEIAGHDGGSWNGLVAGTDGVVMNLVVTEEEEHLLPEATEWNWSAERSAEVVVVEERHGYVVAKAVVGCIQSGVLEVLVENAVVPVCAALGDLVHDETAYAILRGEGRKTHLNF